MQVNDSKFTVEPFTDDPFFENDDAAEKLAYFKKLLLEKTYLPMLAASGLSIALVNMFHAETVRVARACDAILSKRIFSWAEMH